MKQTAFGYIYRITNDVNGKFYIGQTIYGVDFRFQRHIDDATGKRHLNTHFGRAIRKYGPEHFHAEEIDTAYSQEELTRKEYEWIRKTNATKLGYNETYAEFKCGGNTYASKNDAEMKEICRKISRQNSGSGNGNSRAVKFKNINTGEELSFPSVKDAQLHFNEPNHISFTRRCQHIIKSPYNGEWRVAYAEDDYDGDRITLMKKSVSVGPRKILVEDLDTHSNAVYSSYRDFERKNNLKYKSVAVKTTYHKGDTFLFRKRYQITLLN